MLASGVPDFRHAAPLGHINCKGLAQEDYVPGLLGRWSRRAPVHGRHRRIWLIEGSAHYPRAGDGNGTSLANDRSRQYRAVAKNAIGLAAVANLEPRDAVDHGALVPSGLLRRRRVCRHIAERDELVGTTLDQAPRLPLGSTPSTRHACWGAVAPRHRSITARRLADTAPCNSNRSDRDNASSAASRPSISAAMNPRRSTEESRAAAGGTDCRRITEPCGREIEAGELEHADSANNRRAMAIGRPPNRSRNRLATVQSSADRRPVSHRVRPRLHARPPGVPPTNGRCRSE